MNTFINDIRYSIRQLLKSPSFALVAILTLALGIGANTAVFGLLNSVLFRSLPVPNPHELRNVNWTGVHTPQTWGRVVGAPNGEQTSNTFTYPAYCEFRDHGFGMAEVFAFFERGPFNSSTAIIRGQASRVNALMVSGNFFRGLGLGPVLGRAFTAPDDQPNVAPVTVISHRAWKEHFGGDPNVIGQEIVLDQVPATVIGVLPQGFLGIEKGQPCDFYLPLSLQPLMKSLCALESTDFWWVQVMARLEPSIDELEVSRSLEALLTGTMGESGVRHLRILLTDASSGLGGALAPRRGVLAKPLYLLLGLAGIVLLVTCINLAGLLLARGARRQHEFAIRVALGAGRRRMVRQLLTESAALAVMGGAGGLLVALWIKPVLARILWTPDTALNLQDDIHVCAFMLTIVAMTTILSGLLPALRMARTNPVTNLKHKTMGGGSRLGLNKILISLQIGLSLLLLVGAGLLTRTLINIQRIESGLDTENLLVFRADTGPHQTDVCNAVGALPGVQAMSYASLPLLTGARSNTRVPLPDNPSEKLSILRLNVGQTFLQTMGIPLRAGRGFETLDAEESQRVIIINQALARAAFPDDNPVGRFLTIGQQEYRIVGVCGNSKYYDLKMPFEPTVFLPSRQGTCYAIRAAASPQYLVPMVRQTLGSIDASITMSDVTTLKARISDNTRQERSFAWLVSSLALLAVLQSCIGLYGLMAHYVIHRTSEIGLRHALGAAPHAVAWPIFRSALSLAAIGVAIGLPMVWGLVRTIRSHLYGVQPTDPVTILAAVAVLVAVAALAAWLPARRAARIDPMVALRCE